MRKTLSRMAAIALLAVGSLVWAQTPAAAEFDVVSVKLNKSGSNSTSIHFSNGRWIATNVSAKNVILNAFDLMDEQVLGGPGWINSDRFDIQGTFDDTLKLSGKQKNELQQQRLQAMLKDRYQLETHRETREWTTYVLLSGKGGTHKLKPTEKKDGGSSTNTNNGHMEASGVSLENLARNLAHRLGRPVADQTGIEGRFDFTLDFQPEPRSAPSDSAAATAAVDQRPSLVTAVQEQLGLRIESRKTTVEVLVIDRIAHPSEN